ncbi:MAG: hypothetical protein V4700_00680 [Pseudomonadota bacterium]
MLEWIEKALDLKALKEDFRKIGVNFITAGIVGVFINHYTGNNYAAIFLTSIALTSIGVVSLYLGLLRRNK